MIQVINPVERAEKEYMTLRARAALTGHVLHRSWDAGRPIYIISRWGWACELPDLSAVEAFLERAEGKCRG